MIIFGSGSAHLKTAPVKNSRCQNCNNQGTLSISIFRKHAHIFWIPVFPLNKTGASHCSHCQQVLKPKQMPEQLKLDYQNFKGDAKGPVWQFSGLFLMACLMGFGVYSNSKDQENTVKYLAAPVQGDVYEYRIEPGSYSSMKVMEVTTDSLYMSLNEYEISRASKIYKINKPEHYSTEVYGVSRADLQTMKADGDLLEILRE